MNERNIKRITAGLMVGLAAMIVLWGMFGSKGKAEAGPHAMRVVTDDEVEVMETLTDSVPRPTDDTDDFPAVRQSSLAISDVLAMLLPDDTVRMLNPYEAHFDSMPPGGVKMKIHSLGGVLGRVFNDSNYMHLATAGKIGIRPISGPRSAWEQGARLERLQSCRDYYLDKLTHSLPYLVPKAHRLLKDIGAAFRDSLQARGGGDYRIKVTSVLRTPRLVRRLRRRNRNAIDTSAHLFGTTFDISYAKFICDSTRMPRTQEDMKNLLGEVVWDMRRQGRCYVKYERKQACFHITAR